MSYGHFDSKTFYQAEIEGKVGMAISLEAAEKRDPEFAQKAEAQIVSFLESRGRRAPGEDITEAVCKALGCHGRQLGAVYKRLIGKRLRITRYDLPRRHGHASIGGKEYELIA